jgi:two-component system, sensor histidine kinase and response regulator
MALWALWLPLGANAQAPQALRVVSDDNYPPYLFKGPDGQNQGYLVDLWALWERKTGRRVALTATNWARAQKMLLDGEADVIDMIFRTPAREAFYSFSAPYADVPVALYAHQSISGIQSAASLAGFRVGVQEGDACIEHLRSHRITDVVVFSNYQAIIDAAVGQQIKLFCMDQLPGDHYLYRNQLHKDYPKAFDLYVGQFHRAVRRDHSATLGLVEAGMAQISPAEREALQKKWLRPPFDWYEAVVHSSEVLLIGLVLGGLLLLWVRALQRAVRERTAEMTRERARLNAVIRAIPDLVWLKDPQGVYLGCNRAFEGLYGAPEADIVGKTDRDFVDEATAQSFRHHDQKAMAAEQPSINEEWLTFAEDGRRRLFETMKTAMRDGEGTLIGVLGVARDITERKRATEELGRLRHHLEDMVTERTAQLQRTSEALRAVAAEQTALFEAAPVGIAVLRNRMVERCNPRLEAIFGVDPGALLGVSTRQWYVDDAGYEQMGRIYPSVLAGERVDRSVLMRRHNGQVFWAQIHAQAIDTSEPDKGLLVVLEDATAEHEAAEALRLAQAQADMATRLKSAFLSNISHEVRTPLNAILGMTHLAQDSASESERRDYLRHVQSAGQHLLRLFNDLLELSRFEAGQMQLSTAVFDLKGALDALLEVQAGRAAERGLALRLELAPEVPQRLVGDARRLSQLLLVYLDNGIKFTQQGEVVLQVAVKQRGPGRVRLHFVVRDTGIGMDAAQQQSLFRAFEQGDASLSRAHGGLGIGLAMAAQIARLMDGEVGVDSSPGQGSAFWFSVWLGLAEGEEVPRHRLLRVPGRRALVASGESALRDHLVPLLKGFGLTVEAAVSGPDVLRHVHRATQLGQPFDFAFLDAHLPEVDGWQTAQMLRALELPQPLQVMLVADHVTDADAHEDSAVQVLERHATASTVWDAMAAGLAHELPPPVDVPPPQPPADAASGAIDTEAGLRLCGGRVEVYRRLLKQFGDVQAQTLAQLGANDRASVLRAVHRLKAQAESLGAHRLQALSAGVEQHLATRGVDADAAMPPDADPTLASALAELTQEVRDIGLRLPLLLARLAPTVPSDAPVAPEAHGAEAPGDWLAELAQALSDGDVQALALVDRHQDQLQQRLGTRMAEWRQALSRFDFDAALALLNPPAPAPPPPPA